MSPKIASNIRLDPELLDGLRVIREELGIPVSEQVRRAIKEWLERMQAPEAQKTVFAQREAVPTLRKFIKVMEASAKVPGASRPYDPEMLTMAKAELKGWSAIAAGKPTRKKAQK